MAGGARQITFHWKKQKYIILLDVCLYARENKRSATPHNFIHKRRKINKLAKFVHHILRKSNTLRLFSSSCLRRLRIIAVPHSSAFKIDSGFSIDRYALLHLNEIKKKYR